MCNSSNKAGPTTPHMADRMDFSPEALGYAEAKDKAPTGLVVEGKQVRVGQKWYLQNVGYDIRYLGQAYLFTNGDPDARYVSLIRDGDFVGFIITYKAFIREAKSKPDRVVHFISIGRIMEAGPCSSGLWDLVAMFGADASPGSDVALSYRITTRLTHNGDISRKFTVQELYDRFVATRKYQPSAAMLLFIAKILKLVPDGSNGPGRATLLRLLGIEEK